MAAKQKTEVSVSEIPPDVIDAVVLADLAQIAADGATHQDPAARERIAKRVTRLEEIAKGNIPIDFPSEINTEENI